VIAVPTAKVVDLATCGFIETKGKLPRFTTPDLLIIDDLGLRPLTQDEPFDLCMTPFGFATSAPRRGPLPETPANKREVKRKARAKKEKSLSNLVRHDQFGRPRRASVIAPSAAVVFATITGSVCPAHARSVCPPFDTPSPVVLKDMMGRLPRDRSAACT